MSIAMPRMDRLSPTEKGLTLADLVSYLVSLKGQVNP